MVSTPTPLRNPLLVSVVLGVHDLQASEPTQQRFSVARLFENNYDPEENLNDVLLLQVGGSPPSSLGEHLLSACCMLCPSRRWDKARWGDSRSDRHPTNRPPAPRPSSW